jgi:DNA polymerase-3 subunit gamma/tau
VAHQSLYRRYRPRRFGEVRGQDHVVTALRNAVRGGTEGHAYLFSGPRGTGKTSTARILAKALNCEDLRDGEPCCECSSCREIEAGRSFDLFELDAASNNGVDAVRDLIERSVVGSPGRTKVYILDEVHMLSPAASNALLKTLEEPPEHVCFVLATTDPQKVLPTIRSRTQHYEFQLLSAQELEDYVRWIAQDAGLDVDDEAVAHVVRQGHGSARDTLSALDQVVAAGGVIQREEPVDQLLEALAERSSGGAIVAVAGALDLGHDPRVLADALLAALRDAFLLSLDVPVTHLVDADRDRFAVWAERLGTPTLTKAMEAVGAALVDMRQAADPRVPLEVALVRLTSAPSADSGGGAASGELVQRIEALERAVAAGAGASAPPTRPTAPASPRAAAPSAPSAGLSAASATTPDDGDDEPPPGGPTGPAQARAALGAVRAKQGRAAADPPARPSAPGTSAPGPSGPGAPPPAPSARPRRPAANPVPAPSTEPPPGPEPAAAVEPAPAPTPTPTSGAPSPLAPSPAASSGSTPGTVDRDALALAFGDVVMPSLKGMTKAIYSAGRFVAVTDEGAVFAVENAPTRERAGRARGEVEAALSAAMGSPVHLVLIEAADAHRYASGGGPAAPSAAAPSPAPADRMPPPDAAAQTAADASAIDVTAPVDVTTPAADDGAPVAGRADDTAGDEDPGMIDVDELEDADVATSGVDRLTKAFPGAVLVEDGEGTA